MLMIHESPQILTYFPCFSMGELAHTEAIINMKLWQIYLFLANERKYVKLNLLTYVYNMSNLWREI